MTSSNQAFSFLKNAPPSRDLSQGRHSRQNSANNGHTIANGRSAASGASYTSRRTPSASFAAQPMPQEESEQQEEDSPTNPQKPFVYSRSLMLSLWSKERTYDVPVELASIMTDPEAGVISSQPRPPVALQPYDAEEDKLYAGGSLNSEVSMGDRNAADHRYARGLPNGRGSEHPRSAGRASRSERGSLSIQGGVLSGLGGSGQTGPGQEISPPYSRRHRPEQSISAAMDETPTRYLNKKVSNLALGDPLREAPLVDSYKPPAHRADEANSWRRADAPSERKANGIHQSHLNEPNIGTDSPPMNWDSDEEALDDSLPKPTSEKTASIRSAFPASAQLQSTTQDSRRSSMAPEPERISLSTLLADDEIPDLPKSVIGLQEDPLLSRRSPIQTRGMTPSLATPPGLAKPAAPEIEPENVQWIYTDPSGKIQGPFLASQMHGWFSSGYFTGDLLVKKLHSAGPFEPLDQLILRLGERVHPFLVPDRPHLAPRSDELRRSLSGPWQQQQPTPEYMQQQSLNALLAQAQGHPAHRASPQVNLRQFSNNYDPFFSASAAALPISATMPQQYHQPQQPQTHTPLDPWGMPIHPQHQPWQQPQHHSQPAIPSPQMSFGVSEAQQTSRQSSVSGFGFAPAMSSPVQETQNAWGREATPPVWQEQQVQEEARPLLAELRMDSTPQPKPIGTPVDSVPASPIVPEKVEEKATPAPRPASALAPAPSESKPFTEVSHKTKAEKVAPTPAPSEKEKKKGKVATISQADHAKQQEQAKAAESGSYDTFASHVPSQSATSKAAPWAAQKEDAPSASSGPSLREIQEREAKVEENRKAIEKKQRLAQAAKEAEAAAKLAAEQADTLPAGSSWGAKTATPAPQSKGWQKSDDSGKKTLKEIQEEEARQKKAAALKQAQAQAGAPRGYANMAGHSAPKPNDGPWSTIGAGGKATAPVSSPPPRAVAPTVASGPRSIPGATMSAPLKPATTVQRSAVSTPAASSKPTAAQKATSAPPATPDAPKPSAEFMSWTKTNLQGLTVNIDEFISMLLSFPVNPDSATMEIISDAVYANSSTLDGRRFAEQFALKRKADAGLSTKGKQPTVPPATPFARTAADALRSQPKKEDTMFTQIKSKKQRGAK